MVKKLKVTEYFAVLAAILFIALILSAPQVCTAGAKKGLKLCTDFLIPSLFPFAVPVIFIINTRAYKNSKYRLPLLLLLSLTGGYPIGGKLLSELYKSNCVQLKTAEKMLPFCVNAGPAFVVIALGKGMLGSVKLGYILFFSQTSAALILSAAFLGKDLFKKVAVNPTVKNTSFSDNLISAVHTASSACVSVCSFILIFSVFNEYIGYYSGQLSPLKYLIYVTEVTQAVASGKNLYLISFLLGFAGLSVWIQVYSVSDKIRPPVVRFAAIRLLNGLLCTLITMAILKIFRISAEALSTGKTVYEKTFRSGYALALSLLIMALLLIINLAGKNRSGNFIKDVLY